MQLIAFNRMSTRSRRAMARRYKNRYVKPTQSRIYLYRPRITLLTRLASELGLTISKVTAQIQKERRYLLEQAGYKLQPWEVV